MLTAALIVIAGLALLLKLGVAADVLEMRRTRGPIERLDDMMNVKDWGALGDGVNDDTKAINAALSAANALQGRLFFPGGTYKITSDLIIPYAVTLIGIGKRFGSALLPVNCSIKIVAAGGSGGWNYGITIRDLTIDARQTGAGMAALLIDTAYNIRLENFMVYQYAGGLGVDIVTCNDFTLDQVTVYGPNSGAGNYGIRVGNLTYGRLVGCDVEVCNRGIWVTGTASVDIVGLYAERSVYGVYIDRTGDGHCSIIGGHIALPNAGSVGIGLVNADSVLLDNVDFALNGGNGVATDLSNKRLTNVIANNIPLAAFGGDTKNFVKKIYDQTANGFYNDTVTRKQTLVDAVATAAYRFTLANNSIVACKLTMWATGIANGYAKKIAVRQFMLTSPAGATQASAIQAVGTDVSETSSGNYDLTLTATVGVAGATATVNITADSSGALGNGTNSDVYSILEFSTNNGQTYVELI